MPRSYATVTEFRAWTASLDLDLPGDGSDADVQALLDRASNDIDQYLHWPPPADADLDPPPPEPDPDDLEPPPEPLLPQARIPRSKLTRFELWALSKANVEQAAYLCIVGEDSVREGIPTLSAAGGVTFSAHAPDLLGPGVLVSLCACATVWEFRSGTVKPEPLPEPWPIIPPYADETAI